MPEELSNEHAENENPQPTSEFIGPRLPEEPTQADAAVLSHANDQQGSVSDIVGSDTLEGGESNADLESMRQEDKSRLIALMQELVTQPKQEGSRRHIDKAEAERLVEIARLCTRYDVSLTGLLADKEVTPTMIWSAAERNGIPLVSKQQLSAIEALNQEIDALTADGIPDSLESIKASPEKLRVGLLRALLRMNRQMPEVHKLVEKLGKTSFTVANWEKKIRGEDWAEVAPDLFGETEEVTEIETETLNHEEQEGTIEPTEVVSTSETQAETVETLRVRTEENILSTAVATQVMIANLLREIGNNSSDPRLEAATHLARANAQVVQIAAQSGENASAHSQEIPEVSEQSITLMVSGTRVSVAKNQPATIIIVGQEADNPQVVQ